MTTETTETTEEQILRFCEGSETEVCGVVVDGGFVIPMENVAAPEVAHRTFEMNIEELVKVYEKYDVLEAVWHSHPGGSPQPSTEDLDHHPAGIPMLIVCNGKIYEYS